MPEWVERVDSVAKEIEHYLESHPQASDSLEGIATWWISKQRIRNELEVVRAALEKLTHAGVVYTEHAVNEREPVYQLNNNSH